MTWLVARAGVNKGKNVLFLEDDRIRRIYLEMRESLLLHHS